MIRFCSSAKWGVRSPARAKKIEQAIYQAGIQAEYFGLELGEAEKSVSRWYRQQPKK
jgi:hypothetical protein